MSGNGVMDWWRNATPEQKAQRRAEMDAARAAQQAHREQEAAEWREQRAYHLSDEGLQASIDAGGYGTPGGFHPRQARVLLTVPVEYRERVYWEAGTRQNLTGGILSDQMHYAANDMLGLIAQGTPDAEMYGERTARQAREADRAERDQRMAAAVARITG
jgi:hypothetical protein